MALFCATSVAFVGCGEKEDGNDGDDSIIGTWEAYDIGECSDGDNGTTEYYNHMVMTFKADGKAISSQTAYEMESDGSIGDEIDYMNEENQDEIITYTYDGSTLTVTDRDGTHAIRALIIENNTLVMINDEGMVARLTRQGYEPTIYGIWRGKDTENIIEFKTDGSFMLTNEEDNYASSGTYTFANEMLTLTASDFDETTKPVKMLLNYALVDGEIYKLYLPSNVSGGNSDTVN